MMMFEVYTRLGKKLPESLSNNSEKTYPENEAGSISGDGLCDTRDESMADMLWVESIAILSS